MGLFDIFRPIDINEELENMKEIPEAVLLDVREADEYEEEHIPNSVNIPLSSLEMIENMHYAKDIPLFVYCHSGRRYWSSSNEAKRNGIHQCKEYWWYHPL